MQKTLMLLEQIIEASQEQDRKNDVNSIKRGESFFTFHLKALKLLIDEESTKNNNQ